MFTGLCAFPLTPFRDQQIDFDAFERLLSNLTRAKVDSICAMGSTGLYPYLDFAERAAVAKRAVELADGIPVMSGIGALRTRDVLTHAENAQSAGVSALLLAPVSYHPLSQDEVYSLFDTVCQEISVPLCVYENPGVTQFTFSDELYRAIGQLPNVSAIKIPGMPFATDEGTARLAQLRQLVPQNVAVGVSGDKFGAAGMAAGCDLWLSVLGGLFPNTVQSMIQLAQNHQADEADIMSQQLEPLWQLFQNNRGGMRVMATAANILGFAEAQNLPAPLKPLNESDSNQLAKLLEHWQLH